MKNYLIEFLAILAGLGVIYLVGILIGADGDSIMVGMILFPIFYGAIRLGKDLTNF